MKGREGKVEREEEGKERRRDESGGDMKGGEGLYMICDMI